MGTSKNSEFAQMQGAEKNFSSGQPKGYPTLKLRFAAPHMIYMLARNFFRNAAVWIQRSCCEANLQVMPELKSGFLEVPSWR